MSKLSINHFRTGRALFSGSFKTMKTAVEAAISDNVSLAFADLRHANLINAQMDGAILDGAQLDEANLMGANISEASLRRTSLMNTNLHSVTFCDSILDAINARGALFGGTDITAAIIQRCLFDTLSALELNYRDAKKIGLNGFMADNEQLCEFSQTPILIKGFNYPIYYLDRVTLIGHIAWELTDKHNLPSGMFSFIQSHRQTLNNLRQLHTANEPFEYQHFVA